MAENNRSQDIRRSEEAIKQLKDGTDSQFRELKDLLVAMSIKYDQLATRIPVPNGEADEGSHSHQDRLSGSSSNSLHTRYAQIEFPKFLGEDPAGWAYKCERFFEFNQIEDSQKVKLAAMHLDEKGIQWFRLYEKTQPNPVWKDFVFDIRVRFGHNGFEDAIGELTKLTQTTTVKAYQERFKELANLTTGLTSEFYVSCFLSGLKEEIRTTVQMFQPSTISQAIGLARLQEETIEALTRKTRTPYKPINPTWPPTTHTTIPRLSNPTPHFPKPVTSSQNPVPSNVNTQLSTQITIRKLTPKEMEARREKQLCYNCDEKYFRGHRCKRRQLFLLIGDEEGEESIENEPYENEEPPLEDNVQISLAGCNSFSTMRMTGKIKGKTLTILIGSGSTHNFLDPRSAKQFGSDIEATPDLTVAVANGTKLCSKAVCKNLVWEMQGVSFTTEVRLLELGGCDMVLGIQWLSNLGPILWDFKNLSMQFQLLGRAVVLRGETHQKLEQGEPPSN